MRWGLCLRRAHGESRWSKWRRSLPGCRARWRRSVCLSIRASRRLRWPSGLCGLTGVQLHSGTGEVLADRLREKFGLGLRILQVLHYGVGVAEKAGVLAGNKSIDGILVDSRTATAVGGTGIRFDWDAAESLFRGSGTRLIAAGGLTPENVAEAIGKLRPWGVDVASGVEASPGRKDAAKVREFVANSRRASGT